MNGWTEFVSEGNVHHKFQRRTRMKIYAWDSFIFMAHYDSSLEIALSSAKIWKGQVSFAAAPKKTRQYK